MPPGLSVVPNVASANMQNGSEVFGKATRGFSNSMALICRKASRAAGGKSPCLVVDFHLEVCLVSSASGAARIWKCSMHWELNCRKGNTDSISLADLGGSKALSLSSLASSGVMPSLDNLTVNYYMAQLFY